MSKPPANKQHLAIQIDTKVFDELTAIAKGVGFENLEVLVNNYLREVALAARTETATAQLRDTVIRGSTDLEDLKPTKTTS